MKVKYKRWIKKNGKVPKTKYRGNSIFFKDIEQLVEFSKINRILEPVIFLQYVPKKYLDSFSKGNIHFGPIKKYINFQNRTGNKNIGDNHEGRYTYNFLPVLGQNYLSPKNYDSKIEVSLDSKEVVKYGIISFFSIYITDFIKNGNGEWQLNKGIKDELLKLYDKDDSRELVIMDNAGEIIKEFNNKGVIPNRPIIYGNQDTLGVKPIKSFLNDRKSILFYKRNSFNFQREYRFVKDISKGTFLHVKAIEKSSKLIDMSVLMNFNMESIGGINLYLR